jgi:ribosomal protein S18 acetylase RimI-like enzyme
VSVRRTIVEVDEGRLKAASQVVMRALGLTSYATGAIEWIETAARAPGPESRALASARGDALDGVIVFGAFAGAPGAGRIHLVVVDEASRRTGVGRSLAEAAIERMRDERARFVLAELPDDARALPAASAFLAAMEFREESRVENFYRDGVALSFMRLDLEKNS